MIEEEKTNKTNESEGEYEISKNNNFKNRNLKNSKMSTISTKNATESKSSCKKTINDFKTITTRTDLTDKILETEEENNLYQIPKKTEQR